MKRIGLREAIAALRAELTDSILASKEEELRFEVGEINLEFHVEVERTTEGQGGIRFWVVELGSDISKKTSDIHKVTIPLKPITQGGGPVLTGNTGIIPQ